MSGLSRYRRELCDRWLAVRLAVAGRVHQYQEIQALRRLIAHFDLTTVIDVGANAGQYATMLRRDAGFRGTILSFEPNPVVFETLQRHASADPHWHVFNIALSDRDGMAQFNVMAADQFSSLNAPAGALDDIFAERNKVTRTVDVACRTLAAMWGDLPGMPDPRRSLLKMDTQGHDWSVCVGAGALLGQLAALQTELAVRPLYAGATGYREMIAHLETQGYVPNAMFANNKGHFPRLIELDGIFIHGSLIDGDAAVGGQG